MFISEFQYFHSIEFLISNFPIFQATTTECPPNNTVNTSTSRNTNNLLRKLASSHYQSYTTALTVTIAVGCFLLLLNILIFAGIYHQRDRSKKKGKKKQEEAALEATEGGKIFKII